MDEHPAGGVTPPRGRSPVHRLWLAAIAVRQLRARPTLALAQLLTLAAAATLAASVVLIQQSATDQGLRASLAGTTQAANMIIERDGVSQARAYDAFQSNTAARVRSELGNSLIAGAQYARSSSLILSSIDGVAQGQPFSHVSSVTSYTGLRDHVHLVAGQWPSDTRIGADWQLTASARATDELATPLNFHVGSEYCFQYQAGGRGPLQAWCGRIAATWLPDHVADPFWAGHVPETDVATGHDSFFQILTQIPTAIGSAVQQYVPDAGHINAGNTGQVVGAVNRLRGEFSVSSNDVFTSGLDGVISAFLDRRDAASGPTTVTSIGLLVVALAAMGFAALQFIQGHSAQAALWRARGWPRRRVFGLYTLEFALLAALAVPLAILAAALIASAVQAATPGAAPSVGQAIADAAPPTLVAAAVFLAILAALAAALSAPEMTQRPRGRVSTRQRSLRRRATDLLLGVAGAAILVFVHFGGADPSGAGGQAGGIVLALPVLAGGLLAFASLRLVGVTARVATSTRSLGGRLARWQVERDPAQYSRLCLLVTLAVAVGVFASTYAGSDRGAAVDRADYLVGSDIRATFSAAASPPQLDALAASLPRGTRSAQVFRGAGRPGRSGTDATVLGITGQDFWDVAYARSDFAAQPLQSLGAAMAARDPDGLTVPGTPNALSMSVYSSGLDGRAVVDLSDASGRALSLTLGSLGRPGWSEMTASLGSAAVRPDYPVRVRAVRLEVNGVHATGDVALANLRTGSGRLIESFAVADGWWQEAFAPNPAEGDVAPSAAHLANGRPSLDIALDHDTILVEPAPSGAPLPVLLGTQTMADLGVSVGQAFPLHINTVDVQLVPVGSFDQFPTYYPARESFIVAPMSSFLGRLGHAGGSIPWANELWIGGVGNSAGVTSRLASDLDLQSTYVRTVVENAALNDPLRVGLRDELGLGFVVALAVVVIGFALHFLAAARTRSTQFAIMRANGVSEQVIRGSMAAEQVVVLVSGLVAGTLIGFALAWAVVPLFHFGTLPEDLTPPALLRVDALTLALVVLGTGAVALAVGSLVARAGSRVDVMATVRSLS
ncbi:MAG TPA: ABC transporter permease [Solirubrobacteraceae bacterium]|nr:ABC transporter permease [Solirubrobacteraceae bacterium]